MEAAQWIYMLLVGGAVLAAASAYPHTAIGIAYRHRDNGLAYLVLVIGTGLWNGMFAAQYLGETPLVNVFFFSLALVGAQLAGLGWFLFAATASSTPRIPRPRTVYGLAGALVGIDITLTVTTPAHALHWTLPRGPDASSMFAVIVPQFGYWLHTLLLVALFAGGTILFAAAWESGTAVQYTRTYTVAGVATVVAVVGSAVLAPGGLSVASHVAVCLPTVGWLQAKDGRALKRLRSYGWRSRSGQ